MDASSKKPLGRKAYGSIPHLPGSRTGPGDYHCHEGQEAICMHGGKDKRGRPHRVIVTEKLDGSNVAIAKIDGRVYALTRAGYEAKTSQYDQHHAFDAWVNSRSWDALLDGHRVSGEWMYQAHGTLYKPSSPLIAFDAFNEKNDRLLHDDARALFASLGIEGAHVIHDGNKGMTVQDALAKLGQTGNHGALEEIEGAVWRVETNGKFNFLAKYVRPGKIDGKYFPERSGQDTIRMVDDVLIR